MDNVLKAIVCGFEKSGTTLINEIIRRHPSLDSGFEGGFLLGNSPRNFKSIQPYFNFFMATWEVDIRGMEYICDTDDWSECYRRAREVAPLIKDKDCGLFDKTPLYMKHLPEVLAKVDQVPCVVNVRDPRPLMLSWARWSGHKDDTEAWLWENLPQYTDRYLGYAIGYRNAKALFPDRLYLNRFEDLCEDPAYHFSKIFNHIGFDFDESFLHFSSKHFVYGNAVSADYVAPHLSVLSEELCDAIKEATNEFNVWHYDFNGSH